MKNKLSKSLTPICDFVREYASGGSLRFHMPGHKGRGPLGSEALDITEIEGADVLYSAEGIIRESEENASGIFGTARTLYSTEGSSLCIRAMLYLALLAARERGERARLVATRNAHKTFVSAAALLDIDVSWLPTGEDRCALSCFVDTEALELTLERERPVAVYLTSPDYLGGTADVEAVSRICKRHGAMLFVDNAHGAYLKFLERSRHPIDLGADVCCDSAHKTLGVLTGGAYLHLGRTVPDVILRNAESAMSLFASTSPSYLILQSLDAANAELADGYSERIARVCGAVAELKEHLLRGGYVLVGDEPLKLTLAAKAYGYRGNELAGLLLDAGISCEFSDPDFVVCMFSAATELCEIERLKAALCSIEKRSPISERAPVVECAEQAISPLGAITSPAERIECSLSEGRILARPSVSCPPAVPIALVGQRISKSAICAFRYYGIRYCYVVKE